jgi:hypothetical protein
LKLLATSANYRANADLYGILLGHLANLKSAYRYTYLWDVQL